MDTHITPSEAQRLIWTRAGLLRDGWDDGGIARGVTSGHLRRIQRNRYVVADQWDALWPESRHLLQIVAATSEMRRGGGHVGYASAAVVHGLPLYRHMPDRVHLIVPPGSYASGTAPVRRHRERLRAADRTELSGIACSNFERTVFDVLRTVPATTAIACADAALRGSGSAGGARDAAAGEGLREGLRARACAAPGVRGVRQAVRIIEIADGGSESVAESVARWQWLELGFTGVVVQPVIPRRGGGSFRSDLGIPELKAFFELDGRAKYTDPRLREGRSADEVVFAEKLREDEIRARTGWRVIRATEADVRTPEALRALLALYSIRVPR